MERDAVDVDGELVALDREVGDGDHGPLRVRTNRDLLVRVEAVALEEAEELVLERGADAGLVGVEPGARIEDALQGQRLGLRGGQELESCCSVRPRELLVVALVLVALQAAIAGGVAALVVEVLACATRDVLQVARRRVEEAAAANSGIDEGECPVLPAAAVAVDLPQRLELELDLGAVEHVEVPHARAQGVTEGAAPPLVGVL